jgi:hypothetical protein
MQLESTSDMQDAREVVERKIGGNLLLFQQAETLIKRLVALDSLSFHSGETIKHFEERASICNKMTMGQVAKIFLDRICTSLAPTEAEPEVGNTGHDGISVSVRIRIGSTLDPEDRKKSFAKLIEQRNDLVHHLLHRIHPESLENYLKIAEELDAQRREILPEILRLQQDFANTRSTLSVLAEFLKSPAGTAELLLPELQQSSLIRNLAAIAGRSTDPEGWTSLGDAANQLEDFPQEKIREHCELFWQKSLTGLLNASRLFETCQKEATESTRGRTYYRLMRCAEHSPAAMLPHSR